MPRQLAEAQPPLRADPDPLPPSCLLILGLFSFFSALLPLHRLLWNVITPLGNPLRATTQSARQRYPPFFLSFFSSSSFFPFSPPISLSLSFFSYSSCTLRSATVGIGLSYWVGFAGGWFRGELGEGDIVCRGLVTLRSNDRCESWKRITVFGIFFYSKFLSSSRRKKKCCFKQRENVNCKIWIRICIGLWRGKGVFHFAGDVY